MSEPVLKRRIGLWGAVLLAFNGAVGGGIFILPATLAAEFGTFSPWLFPIVAIGSLLIVVPFAATAAAFPESGGPATYGRVFGRFAGFELGWIYYVARAAAFAANANVLVAYLARWVPGSDQGWARWSILIVLSLGLAAANIVGVTRALRLLAGFTLLKALPLVAVAVAALILFAPIPDPGRPPFSELEAGVLLVFYAFIGFENGVVPAGETRRPATTLPRAILATIAVTALLYFLVQLAFVTALPGGAPGSAAPLIDLGQMIAGPAGAALLTLAAIASLAGNLHGNMTATPRVTFVMAVRGDLPHWYGRVHARFATPANSILFMGFVTAGLAISGSFVWLAVIATLARLIVYAVTIAARPRAPAGGRISRLLWVTGAAGIALCGWAASQAELQAWVTLAALAAAGAVLYALATRAKGSSSAAASVSTIVPPPSSRSPS